MSAVRLWLEGYVVCEQHIVISYFSATGKEFCYGNIRHYFILLPPIFYSFDSYKYILN